MHAYVHGCVCASMILLDTLRRSYSDFLSVHTCAYACVCIRVCMYVHIGACVYLCICVYIYVCVYLYIYIYIRARVGVHMHSCRCILFICSVQSLYYMRVYHKCFLIPACVCVGGLEVGVCFRLFMVSACCWRGRLCFGWGRDRGFVLYISLFLRVLGWCVCVCLYLRLHTHKLIGYLM